MTENETPTSESSQETSPSCCEGGDCCPAGSSTGARRAKTVVFVLIVVAAGAVMANSLISRSRAAADGTSDGFALPQASAVETPSTASATTVDEPAPLVPSAWKTSLSSLADLNRLAADVEGVFVFIGTHAQRETASINSSMNTTRQALTAHGTRVGTYWLEPGTADYENLARQVTPPCILALVKGGSMAVVSGEISEAKIMQAYAAASRPSSGCCAPGASCGPAQ